MSEEKTHENKKIEFSPALAILVAGVIIAGAILYTHMNPAPAAVADSGTTNLPASVDIPAPSATDHIIGSPTAPIVLVEYSDFQCPYCSMVYPTIKQIVSESNGQVAWVMRNFPLDSIHPQARPAALAAECLTEQMGNNAWWKFADTVFGDQSKLSPAYDEQLALSLGADKTKFETCLTSKDVATKLDAQSGDAIASGGTGTPFTVVYGNGKEIPIPGAFPYDQFKAVIASVLARQPAQ